MEVILDTNAVSDYISGNGAVRELLRNCTRVIVPTVVIGEYLFGIEGMSSRERAREVFERLLRDCIVATIDQEAAEGYAKVRLILKKQGTPIPTNDAWIAALAIQYGAVVLSRDRHFDRIESLRRIDWT